jgi:hypothetical protein
MPLLAELFAFVLPATYKDLAPTEQVVRSAESGRRGASRFSTAC